MADQPRAGERTWRFTYEGGEIPVLWLNDTPIEVTAEQAIEIEKVRNAD